MIPLEPVKINVAFNCGGLGDNICRLPATKYCLDNWQHVEFDIYVPDYFVDLARHLLRGYEDRAQFIPMSRIKLLLDNTLPSVSFHNEFCTSLRMHLVDHAFVIMAGEAATSTRHKNYPKLRLDEIDTVKFKLQPDTYVCLTPGYTAATRALPAKTWNEIAQYLLTRGQVPVWLGSKESPLVGSMKIPAYFASDLDCTVGIDLRDKTTLLEAGKIMALSSAVVGLDNGLMHLAATSDVSIIAAYSSVSPDIRLPIRKGQLGWNTYLVEPEKSLACRYCQVSTHFLYSHDYRTCYTKTLDCISQLTSKKFIQQLELAL